MTRNQLKVKTCTWDSEEWSKELREKSSIKIYREQKKDIMEEDIYVNTPASITLYKARANCLPLNDRKRYENQETKCKFCNAEKEDLEHFLLICPEYKGERKSIIELQQPYEENTNNMKGNFLFDTTRLQQKKEALHRLWTARERKNREQRKSVKQKMKKYTKQKET